MSFFDKLEQKIGKYAIPHLILILVAFYAIGLLIQLIAPQLYSDWLWLDFDAIGQGQVWRLITYMLYPPSTNILWAVLGCYVLYSLGTTIERLWGTFYLNLYVFIGLIANLAGAFLIYRIWGVSYPVTADQLYLSFLLAFSLTLPDAEFLLFFVLPVKAKYLAILYGIVTVIELIVFDWPSRIIIFFSLLNFLIFFLLIKRPVKRVQQVIRMQRFRQDVRRAAPLTRHRCAVCGRTEKNDPSLEFRFCSKCAGGKEYCMEHLYTHVHVTEADLKSSPDGVEDAEYREVDPS